MDETDERTININKNEELKNRVREDVRVRSGRHLGDEYRPYYDLDFAKKKENDNLGANSSTSIPTLIPAST